MWFSSGSSDAGFWPWFFGLPWPFFATIIVAIAAVWMAKKQANVSESQLEVMREHNKLTVRPHLKITTMESGHKRLLKFYLNNVGAGPALFTEWHIWVDGKPFSPPLMPVDWVAIVKAAGIVDYDAHGLCLKPGAVLAAGQQDLLFKVKLSNSKREIKTLTELHQKTWAIKIRLDYESLYEEQFTEWLNKSDTDSNSS